MDKLQLSTKTMNELCYGELILPPEYGAKPYDLGACKPLKINATAQQEFERVLLEKLPKGV
jgi:hypothetical protein